MCYVPFLFFGTLPPSRTSPSLHLPSKQDPNALNKWQARTAIVSKPSLILRETLCESQKAADVWKTDVWDFQAFSQTFLELRFSLGNEGKDSTYLNSQTWPGTPRRPSPRHPRPSESQEGGSMLLRREEGS